MPITSNIEEVKASLRARIQKLDGLVENAAREGAEILRTNTLPLARVDTGKWRDSIMVLDFYQIAPCHWGFKFGSEGAFAADGFDYGAYWNFWDGTIDTGRFISIPELDAMWQRTMSELKNG
jgi:hypothetical protein